MPKSPENPNDSTEGMRHAMYCLATAVLLEGVGGRLVIRREDFERFMGCGIAIEANPVTSEITVELLGRPV